MTVVQQKRKKFLKPHSRRFFIFFFISKNLISTGKSTAAKAGVAAMLPPALYSLINFAGYLATATKGEHNFTHQIPELTAYISLYNLCDFFYYYSCGELAMFGDQTCNLASIKRTYYRLSYQSTLQLQKNKKQKKNI